MEDDEDKKQVNFTYSNFPNCLKTQQKKAIKKKKQTCARKVRNKVELIPSGFPSALWLNFSKFDHFGHVEDNLHKVEYGN